MSVGIGVVEELRDRRVGACLDLALEIQQVIARALGLRMPFRVGGDLDVEPVTGLLADEVDELVGIAKFADIGHAGRQIAAQGDDAADAVITVVMQDLADVFACRADAGKVRAGRDALGGDLHDDVEGAAARRAAGAISDGEEARRQRGEPGARRTQFFEPLGRLRREEFAGDFRFHDEHGGRIHGCRRRR